MANSQTINELNRLIRICLDGEAGFLVVSESVRNRGLKALFKTFAQQRGQFAKTLQQEVKRLGGDPRTSGSTIARLHRGWINIKSAMTIGQHSTENVALTEIIRGESRAVQTYENALNTPLPDDVKAIVQEQYEKVQAVSTQVQQMRGRSGTRTIVRLFDREEDAEQAIASLKEKGFDLRNIQKVDVGEVINVYEGSGHNAMVESTGAGALVGLVVGAILGLIFGLATLFVPQIDIMGMMGDNIVALVIVTLALGAGVGAAFGAFFGAIIGRGTIEEDMYLYADSVASGSVLLSVQTDSKRAEEASEIMLQVNAARPTTPRAVPST